MYLNINTKSNYLNPKYPASLPASPDPATTDYTQERHLQCRGSKLKKDSVSVQKEGNRRRQKENKRNNWTKK